MTTSVERIVREQWLGNAVQAYFGRCDTCGRTRDDNERALTVARQPRSRLRECLECFDERTAQQ